MKRWAKMAEESSIVEQDLYTKYDVKRGLRDVTGRGVLAGLTQIGELVAYSDDDPPVAIPGQLIYRGIQINDLVDGFMAEGRLGFEETAYLLLFGELPNKRELGVSGDQLTHNRSMPRNFIHDAILRMPSRDTMNGLARGVLALYTLDSNPNDTSVENVLRQCLHLISKFPMLAVYSYLAHLEEFHDESLVIHRPLPHLSTAENFLHMLRRNSKYTELEAKVLDLTLVLQAEHGGGNNSSFTTHVVSSSGTDTYSAVAASLGSLKGPRHGGANIKVAQMFDDLKEKVSDWEDEDEIKQYLLRVLDKKEFDGSGLIYGMGHPVYAVSDPRALILRDFAQELAAEKGMSDEFELQARVERIAPIAIRGERTIFKGVSANVDFYSGFVFRMLDIPSDLYTPLFAMARIVGWSAHRIEEISNRGKVIRPAYKSVASRGTYVPLTER